MKMAKTNSSLCIPMKLVKTNSSLQRYVGSDDIVCDVCTDKADHLIMCDRCEIWYCHRCAGINVIKLVEVLIEFKELHWFCNKCDEIAVKAIQSFNPDKVSSLDIVQRNIADILVRIKNLNKVAVDTANQFKKTFADALKSGKDKQISLLVIQRLTKPLLKYPIQRIFYLTWLKEKNKS